MKPFRFKQFSLVQHPEVFAVGTDGVVLGATAQTARANRILEVGPGTGLISLMLAQRFPQAHITAVEIDPRAAELCQNNFSLSPFSGRLEVLQSDIKGFETEEKFDALVCNPPFFPPNASLKHVIARQQLHLTYAALFQAGHRLLSPTGSLHLIYPENDTEEVQKAAADFGLKHEILVRGMASGPVIRRIQHWQRGYRGDVHSSKLCLEVAPRQYSPEYLALTREFHVFKTKDP